MSNKTCNVVVTGAAGQIGYAALFRLASGAMLGPDVNINLNLLELDAAMPALRGVAMELEDCAFPLLKNIICTSDINEAMRDANWVLLIGSVPRKAGMERADLLKVNGQVFTTQGRAINDNAADDVRVFVVGNPCNTNCLITMHNAPDIPNDRFFAMTTLDENRARAQLAQRAGVPFCDVGPLAIWGNHSATQYPDFYHATISGKPAAEVIDNQAWLQGEFISTVQQRGAAVIKARGASSAASAANAALQGVTHLSFDTPPDHFYSMCRYSNGEYGVDEGLIFSFPCQTKSGVCRVVEGWEHNDFAKEKLDTTLNELRQERQAVRDMGLIG